MRFRLESLSFRKLLYISTFQYISCSPKQPVVHGDVNGDDTINISDVTALIDMILSDSTDGNKAADVNGDGIVNISDVTALIDSLLI